MADIKPFRAVRATRDKIHLVATRTLGDYKKNVLNAKIESNPYSFIHIIYPDYFSQKKTKPNSKERHELIREVYLDFIQKNILLKDDAPALYLYRQTSGDNVYYGVIGTASVEEYDAGLIKKHEATLSSREQQFTDYLSDVGFNAEPVLLTYPTNQKLDELYVKIMQQRPEYEFSTTDRIKHELWVMSTEETNLATTLFKEVEAAYIADGHHRSASSSRLSKVLGKDYPKSNYFLAFFIDEMHLKIMAFHRVIKKVEMTNDEFLSAVREKFEVQPLVNPRTPNQKHELVINLRNQWYALNCNPEIRNDAHPVKGLDTFILTQYLLDPILQIKDLRTDKNVQFVSDVIGIDGVTKMIQSGKADLGILLYPISIEQVKDVSDNNMIMPPKSTWIEPKMRTGLTIYDIKE